MRAADPGSTELLDAIDTERWTGPSEADIGDLMETTEDAIREGAAAQRKALLRALVATINVERPEAIHPVLCLPAEPRFDLCQLRSSWWAAVDSDHLPPR